MGLRRFFADCSDCTEEGVLGVKIGPKVASDFYTQLYTFCQRSLGTRMDARFFDGYDFENCTFNPFVVGSTPRTSHHKTQSLAAINLEARLLSLWFM